MVIDKVVDDLLLIVYWIRREAKGEKEVILEDINGLLTIWTVEGYKRRKENKNNNSADEEGHGWDGIIKRTVPWKMEKIEEIAERTGVKEGEIYRVNVKKLEKEAKEQAEEFIVWITSTDAKDSLDTFVRKGQEGAVEEREGYKKILRKVEEIIKKSDGTVVGISDGLKEYKDWVGRHTNLEGEYFIFNQCMKGLKSLHWEVELELDKKKILRGIRRDWL